MIARFLTVSGTLTNWKDKLRAVRNSQYLPLMLLLLALSTVFLFGNDRGHFYRNGHHDWNSSQSMAFAENFSLEHKFLIFHHLTLNADGNLSYQPYNRFPIGGYALIKLSILPFGDNLEAKIFAARLLMLLLFSAGAVLAYCAISKLTSQRWIALSATLLAFSSYYCLYYSDKISNEVTIDLFAVLLAFHGMVIFEQEGRFRQLLIKVCVTLFLGWHVYALLLPFILLGLSVQIIKARWQFLNTPPPPPVWSWRARLPNLARPCLPLFRNRYLALGIVALILGMALLSFNFANEYFALKSETPLTELPSFRSMTYRFGQSEEFNSKYEAPLEWPTFLKDQFYRIGYMSTPYPLTSNNIAPEKDPDTTLEWVIVGTGIGVSVVCLIGPAFARHKPLWATLFLSGFFWTFPMRHSTAFHDFEGVFYIGVSLVFFSLALLYLRGLYGNRFVYIIVAIALGVFVLSAFQMAQVGHSSEDAEFHTEVIADFEVIREMTEGKSVFVLAPYLDQGMYQFAGAPKAVNYYLSGIPILYPSDGLQEGKRSLTDFFITRERVEGPALLTPDNRRIFLYDRPLFDSQIERIAMDAEEPVIRSVYNVYLHENTLIYVKDQCSLKDVETTFFLHLIPVDKNDLPEYRKQYNFDNLDFRFQRYGFQSGQQCIALVPLPEYDIAIIRTGQYIRQEGGSFENVWQGSLKINGWERLSPGYLLE